VKQHFKNLPILSLLTLSLLVGLLTFRQYGESWDELQFYKYADHALESYCTWYQRGEVIYTGNTYDQYGPAFVIFAQQIARALNLLNPSWLLSDLRHLVYFITFVAGVATFHSIARRWMNPTAAFGATLLFITQPIFWGDAFISPKDIPFLNFFLISLALGLHMADSPPTVMDHPPRLLLWLSGFWILSLLMLFFFPRFLEDGLAAAIRAASANPSGLFATLLRSIASDFGHADVELYVQKMRLAIIWAKAVYLLVSTGLLIWLYRIRFPAIFSLFSPSVLFASLALGFTTSIRVLGPLAGLIIAIYALQKSGRKALPMLAIYAGLSIAVMLAAWPYLWPDPPARLVESVRVMTQYPWKGRVLFNGQYYASTNLPFAYLPVLLAIQFTEPVWPLFILGLYALRKHNHALIALVLWFFLPLVGLIALRAPLYDNARQVFFIFPLVFLVAGLGIEWLLNKITRSGLSTRQIIQSALMALLILPGLLAGFRLHPYEYVYYNSLVGNPTGRFELEYWATSYREGAQWLNTNAEANAVIAAVGPAQIADLYVRQDLTVLADDTVSNKIPDYALITTRYGLDSELFPEAQVVHKVERAGMTFAVIKKLMR
jgi:hypothetical protein